MAQDPHLVKNLLALKKRSFDVKFDLRGTEYVALENIGSGAYGVVCCARHERTREKVAIKKIPDIFHLTTTAKRTLREIKILRHFRHENIISIIELLQVRDAKTFKDVYVVLDLMESDLHRIIHSNQLLTEEHVRYFIYQLLKGLKYIHSANITHRDLKPQNLLVNENCLLKIGDFGMARGLNRLGNDVHHKQCMTQYVATRWYRAPELIMLFDDYTEAVDMWSVGCILAEMLGRKQIFPAKDVLSQLQMIIMTLGTPPDYLLQRTQSDIVRGLVRSVKVGEGPVSLSSRYPKSSRKAIDMLSGLLVLDPNKRLTATQALKHLFVNKYHDPTDEPTCEGFDFTFEYRTTTCDQLRLAIYEEIQNFHSENAVEVLKDTAEVHEHSEQPLQFLVAPDNVFEVPNVIAQKGLGVQNDFTVSHDVEMLSAKSTVDTEMTSANPQPPNQEMLLHNEDHRSLIERSAVQSTIPVQKAIIPNDVTITSNDVMAKHRPDLTVSTSKPEKNKTISEDTKALIKAALSQSTNRRRMSETGDSQIKKPVTAQQRQKEREERRRKKSEKSSKRKSKEKFSPEMTEDDKSMLERWQNMAPPPPVAPPSQIANPVTRPTMVVGPQPIGIQVYAASNPIVLASTTLSFLNQSENTVVIQTQGPTLVSQPANFSTTQMASLPIGPVSVTASSNHGLPFLSPPRNVENQTQYSPEQIVNHSNLQQPNLQQNQPILIPEDQRKSHGLQHLQELQKQIPVAHRTQGQPLQFISPPKVSDEPLKFISPPKCERPLSYVDAASKRSWTEAPFHASPGTKQSFIQTHSLIDQLNEISRPDSSQQTLAKIDSQSNTTSQLAPQKAKTLSRDPLLGQCSQTAHGGQIPVICIDDSASDDDVRNSHNQPGASKLSKKHDLLADMTKQFSKSQVDDSLPPNLISTPKGGGEGYGVGLDLDEILHEWIVENKNSVTPESAPLSASTLTDWLQVAGNVDPRDMADLQRELDLSPMVTAD